MPISAPLLLVEDDNSVRHTLTTFLDLEGYQVEAVSSTRAAMEKLLNGSYPIVISDIYLDERTGLDVLRAAKESNDQCRVILEQVRAAESCTQALRSTATRLGPAITLREREILALIAQGRANKEIAAALSISEDTVKRHVSHILEKLNVHDRAEATAEAIRRGIVKMEG